MNYRRARVTFDASGNRVALCAVCDYVSSGPRPNRWHYCPSAACPPCGPGCQLKRTLAWWGIRDDGSCGCTEFSAQMDAWGPDECFRRIEEIVEHLRQAAEKKGLPFIATAARIMIGRAIEAARAEAAATPPPG